MNNEELVQEILTEIQACDDEDRYRSLRDQLYGFGEEVIPALRVELESPHFRRRMAAATNLGRLGDKDSVPALITLLNDPQAGVREMVLFALGILGVHSAVEPILGSLTDYDADVRYRAVVALTDLNYPQLEDVLIRAMGDESYGVREQALSQLRAIGTPRATPVILKALLEREREMQQMAEEALDRLIPRMTREHYQKVRDDLTPRERRLILNYLEARNLQEVYGTLWSRLQIVSKKDTKERGLDKYGRLLNSEFERELLNHAYGRDAVVSQLVDHFTDEDSMRSILLVGEAGVGKTAIIHEMTHQLVEADETWKILETNTSELISGTRYLGDWETKLKEMAEAIMAHDQVILYLTNPNDLLGAGAHSKSDENFADFFKPYLHRGQLKIIAECTEESLRNGLTRDPGFLRLFRQIKVNEMSDAQTLDVLMQRVEALESSSKPVYASEATLEHVVDFARSFYTRSTAPGRAFDLLDALIDYVGRTKSPEDEVLRIDADDIPGCLSEVTGMSLDLLDDTIPLDLAQTRAWFTKRLIDQDAAVDAMIDRLALIKAGMANPQKPLAVFFLVGPTGVGKTFFTQLVAERLFGDRKRMLRFDLSEYQGRFAIEKLIGSPHDKDREGLLTEAVRNQPFSVLLFDEFEKADQEIFSLFLQILDEGRLTDARGDTTDFRQTLIFLTSNLGASRGAVAPVGFSERHAQGWQGHLRKKLDEFFAPEFLNRLDDIVIFEPLTEHAMDRLVEVELERALERRGVRRRNLKISTDREARAWLEERGFSQRFGARELKRTIEKHLLTPISRLLVSEPGPHNARVLRVSVDSEGEIAVAFESGRATEAPDPDSKPAIPREPTQI